MSHDAKTSDSSAIEASTILTTHGESSLSPSDTTDTHADTLTLGLQRATGKPRLLSHLASRLPPSPQNFLACGADNSPSRWRGDGTRAWTVRSLDRAILAKAERPMDDAILTLRFPRLVRGPSSRQRPSRQLRSCGRRSCSVSRPFGTVEATAKGRATTWGAYCS